LPREAGEFCLRTGYQQQVHPSGCQSPGDVLSDAMRGSGDDGVALFHGARFFAWFLILSDYKIILLEDNLSERWDMGNSVALRWPTGCVGQFLFVAQQAAQALAIKQLKPLKL